MRATDDSVRNVGANSVRTDIPASFDTDPEDRTDTPQQPSLLRDLTVLFEDTKTYLQAETAFQKSRAAFVSNRLKRAAAYGAAAFGVLHLALIAIAVGLVIALAPLVGPWLATFIVGAALIVAGVIFLRKLKGQIDAIRSAFEGEER